MSAAREPLGPGQSSELHQAEKMYLWKLKKIDGGTEQILILKVRGIHMYMCMHMYMYSIDPNVGPLRVMWGKWSGVM